ncbi:unnamed protein product [Litomosoides sigmodontis]|uniref:Uncharacterized protein n=1 Tax=Litomosoides sigmodontis TaxID=42156 RepID=A0A3P6S6P4_LITSI|nr:unnamed protein product [Litomosoides sigmodontis]
MTQEELEFLKFRLTRQRILEVTNYVQSLWAEMQNVSDNFNGITECVNTLIGAIISFSMQYVRKGWTVHEEFIISVTSAITALLLAIMSQSKSVLLAYAHYVAITAIYTLLMTAACATIALELKSASYGFVFGLNTFVALLLESIITVAFVDKHGFALPIREQASFSLFPFPLPFATTVVLLDSSGRTLSVIPFTLNASEI